MGWTLVKEMNKMDYVLNEMNAMDYGMKVVRWNMIVEVNNVT